MATLIPCYRPKKFADPAMPPQVPCGRCIGCLERRRRDWAVRMTHEAQLHAENCFITLTYSDEHLPEDHSLDVTHWQLFAKRLRKQHSPFRFYHCGEYGPETNRPHLHACLFGTSFNDQVETGISSSGHPTFTSPILEKIWGKGRTTVQPFTEETAGYVAGYVIKKDWSPQATQRLDPMTGETWDVKPEYATMSRNPGIASDWFDRFKRDVYPHGYVLTSKGVKLLPPKYYDNKLPEDELLVLQEKRKSIAQKRTADSTPERLRTRESFREAKFAFLHNART